MPPVGQPLTAEEKGRLRKWINDGAKASIRNHSPPTLNNSPASNTGPSVRQCVPQYRRFTSRGSYAIPSMRSCFSLWKRTTSLSHPKQTDSRCCDGRPSTSPGCPHHPQISANSSLTSAQRLRTAHREASFQSPLRRTLGETLAGCCGLRRVRRDS
jgi:hypothetical protein